MFGFSFGELLVLVIVGVVVLGPKELPVVLRKLGQWSARLRRMASDLRAQSGIDEVLREGDMGQNIAELRKLARGELDTIRAATDIRPQLTGPAVATGAAAATSNAARDPYAEPSVHISRDREYPREGADSYRALSDAALVFANTLPASPLASDPLYVLGDRDGVILPPAATDGSDAPPSPPAPDAPDAPPDASEPTSP